MITIKCSLHNNLGDRPTNEFLGMSLSKQEVKLITWTAKESSYMICGSLLKFALANNIIWGSGFMFESDKILQKPKEICAVRGRLSREILLAQNIPCPEIYGDPALLYPKFYNPDIKKQYELGIIPHYIDKDNKLLSKFNNSNILIIDIMTGYKNVISQILSCKKIASSALHGIIVADAYDIPAIWIKLSDKVLGNGFKFRDYFSSVNRPNLDPLCIDYKTSSENIFDSFYSYKIQIDLEKLYKSCPFKHD